MERVDYVNRVPIYIKIRNYLEEKWAVIHSLSSIEHFWYKMENRGYYIDGCFNDEQIKELLDKYLKEEEDR